MLLLLGQRSLICIMSYFVWSCDSVIYLMFSMLSIVQFLYMYSKEHPLSAASVDYYGSIWRIHAHPEEKRATSAANQAILPKCA